jgi:hypothetical protein
MMKKSRGSRITTNTYFTRLQEALKLKFAPHFAPLINLLKQTYEINLIFWVISYFIKYV